jgi:hypothetical protein
MKEVYRSLMRRRSMWYKRLLAEYKYCTGSTFFITLTYEDSHVPMEFGSDGLPLFYTTSKRDVQLWFKRIRKRCVSDLGRIRYFIVSEFGENTGRPMIEKMPKCNFPFHNQKFKGLTFFLTHDKYSANYNL